MLGIADIAGVESGADLAVRALDHEILHADPVDIGLEEMGLSVADLGNGDFEDLAIFLGRSQT